jgi:hypothetical protein
VLEHSHSHSGRRPLEAGRRLLDRFPLHDPGSTLVTNHVENFDGVLGFAFIVHLRSLRASREVERTVRSTGKLRGFLLGIPRAVGTQNSGLSKTARSPSYLRRSGEQSCTYHVSKQKLVMTVQGNRRDASVIQMRPCPRLAQSPSGNAVDRQAPAK